MPRIIEKNKELICGCCGTYFRTWQGYVDQDQDTGYGQCNRCQGDAKKDNEQQYDNIWNTITGAMKDEEVKARILKKVEEDPQMKIVYVNMAIAKGLIKWSIG